MCSAKEWKSANNQAPIARYRVRWPGDPRHVPMTSGWLGAAPECLNDYRILLGIWRRYPGLPLTEQRGNVPRALWHAVVTCVGVGYPCGVWGLPTGGRSFSPIFSVPTTSPLQPLLEPPGSGVSAPVTCAKITEWTVTSPADPREKCASRSCPCQPLVSSLFLVRGTLATLSSLSSLSSFGVCYSPFFRTTFSFRVLSAATRSVQGVSRRFEARSSRLKGSRRDKGPC